MLLSLLLLAGGASASISHPRNSRHHQVVRKAQSLEARGKGKDSAPAGGFQIVGDSGVSAQMMFLGTKDTVYILDKAENNALTVTGANGATHPAWGTRYDLRTNQATPMEVTSNTFCAGGFAVGNGSWVVFGGNQPVTAGGVAVNDKGLNPTGANPYLNTDGGEAIRLLNPCDDDSCVWQEGGDWLTMTSKRWYPTIEGLADGRVIVLGGDINGGYVSTQVQNNPTYEYWPKEASGKITMQFLNDTVPVNLFPLTWLLPSGKLFLQAAYRSILYDMDARKEIELARMPYAQRVYPASAAAVMLPLTPANNYEAELLFCGGSNADLSKSSDGGAGFNVTAVVADDSCVRIRPDDANPVYTDDDRLPEPRSMGQLIYLPDGTLWLGNGVRMGTAGYGDEKWSVGQSYGQDPIYMPAVYNPNAPSGSRFSRKGLKASTEERMYHSSAILLGDGSILVSGSNPNKDFTTEQWATKYSVEKWYPSWYNEPRPLHSGYPASLSYGGPSWTITLTNKLVDPSNIKVVVIRTGFSTHAMNFGQRYLELETSFSKVQLTGEITMIVSQMPPNANIFSPGPAMIFLVVDGVPAEGEMIMIGSGEMGVQPLLEKTELPQPQIIAPAEGETDSGAPATPSTTKLPAADTNIKTSAANAMTVPLLAVVVAILAAVWA